MNEQLAKRILDEYEKFYKLLYNRDHKLTEREGIELFKIYLEKKK